MKRPTSDIIGAIIVVFSFAVCLTMIAWGFVARGATPEQPVSSLDARAHSLALNAACGDRTACRSRRSDEARVAARIVLDACSQHMPRQHCLTLVATLAESQMHAHPTCSSKRCRDKCGTIATGKQRRCRIICEAGSERGVRRALRCNDGGTSTGWFQMKRILLRSCAKQGTPVDPYDLASASTCYAYHVARVAKANSCRIKHEPERWRVAFARVAAGPFTRVKLADGVTVRRSRCWAHGYARRAARSKVKHVEYPRAVR